MPPREKPIILRLFNKRRLILFNESRFKDWKSIIWGYKKGERKETVLKGVLKREKTRN